MQRKRGASGHRITRRAVLAGAGATAAMAATPALAQQCQIGPPKHAKGPLVFLDYDQLELDAAYKQEYYEPLGRRVRDRLAGVLGVIVLVGVGAAALAFVLYELGHVINRTIEAFLD